jgi:hypothetical protein
VRRERESEIQHVRFVAETERLGLKCELEVKKDIFGKENKLLVEERKRMKQDFREVVLHNENY